MMQNQQRDKKLIKIAQNYKDYYIESVHGAGKKYSIRITSYILAPQYFYAKPTGNVKI